MKSPDRYLNALLFLSIAVNVSGLFVTIIGPDGTLYASVAKTMAQRNNYIELFAEGHDWLDKPHFPFWVTALSYEVLGFTSFAYKLPALLFLLIGAYYTYAFALRLYNKQVAVWSTIILLTAEHIIISSNDVRAEPYLTGLIIAGLYHFYRAMDGRETQVDTAMKSGGKEVNVKGDAASFSRRALLHLMAGAFFAACAVMTKGLFALVPIGGAIAGELIIKRKWRSLFHIRWLIAGVLVLLFVSPELYCLYYQFDMHPEKVVFGRTGVSGVRFFFWDSQFGRFFNTGPIKGKGDPFFFVHTVLWAFLPWSLLLYAGIWNKVRGKAAKRKGHLDEVSATQDNSTVRRQEWFTICGSMLCFLMFSASKFQLPHYMNVVFPLFAILTAGYVLGLKRAATVRVFTIIQRVVVVLLIVLAIGLHLLFLPGRNWLAILLLLAGIGCWFAFGPLFREGGVVRVLAQSALVVICINFYLNLVFYPALLQYQSGSEAARYANKHFEGVPVVQFADKYNYSLEFYLNAPLHTLDTAQVFGGLDQRSLVYVPVKAMETINLKPVRVFDHFHVSRLTLKLVNARTRDREVEQYGLYLVGEKQGQR